MTAASGQTDHFNNVIPFFSCRRWPDDGCPVASPDGKHIYAASDSGEGPKGIAFFERVGNELVDVMEESAPDAGTGDVRQQRRGD